MSPIDPALRIAGVQLAVADLARSVAFYERVLGLSTIELDEHRALLGDGGPEPLLTLTSLEQPTAPPRGSSGLFHVAWLHPSRAGLADTVRRVAATGWRIEGASDHGVSEALYLSDPDGLGIEVYADRPRETWQRPADGHGVSMVTLPLDLEDLLAQSPAPPPARIEPGTHVGHVHLKVADVDRTAAFYQNLGFEQQARLPGAAFLSAGGYHHHVGLNSWQSAGHRRAPDSAPGLRRVTFELSDEPALQGLARRGGIETQEGQLSVLDPDGEPLSFALPAAVGSLSR